MRRTKELLLITAIPVIIVIICLLIYCFTAALLPIDYYQIIKVDNMGKSILFKCGKLLGFGICVVDNGSGIFGVKPVGIDGTGRKQPFVLKMQDREYIVDASGKKVSIYSFGENGVERWDSDMNMDSNKDMDMEFRNIISGCSGDLDGDGNYEILLIDTDDKDEYEQKLLIVKLGTTDRTAGGKIRLAVESVRSIDMSRLKPWMVQTCDVEGDGRTDISVGVYKTTEFHPVEAKRPFIYNAHEDGLSPKWLGSRLSRPFDRYIFADVDSDGKDDLIAIEYLEDGSKVFNAYGWKGFGFEAVAESRSFQDIDHIQNNEFSRNDGSDIIARVKTENGWCWASFRYSSGVLETVLSAKHPGEAH